MIRLILFTVLFFGCDPSPTPKKITAPPSPPATPAQPVSQNVVYSGTMSITNRKIYSQFLENARFQCQNRTAFGNARCDNWVGTPTVELVFNDNLTQLKSFTLTPKGSGSLLSGGNRNYRGFPISFHQNNPVQKINEDKGWMVSLNVHVTRLILYCGYCDLSKGDLDDLMAFRGSRDYEIGTLSVHRNSNINRLSSY